MGIVPDFQKRLDFKGGSIFLIFEENTPIFILIYTCYNINSENGSL